jgi:hypothetical protein
MRTIERAHTLRISVIPAELFYTYCTSIIYSIGVSTSSGTNGSRTRAASASALYS